MLYGLNEEDLWDDEDDPHEDILTVVGHDPDEWYREDDEERAERKAI